MTCSVIKDASLYLEKLDEILRAFGIILEPEELFSLVEIKMTRSGVIVGWEILGKEVKFASGEFLDCDEFALIEGDRWIINTFSFHFQPGENQTLSFYRIDLDQINGLHLNSSSEETGHIPAELLHFDISNFNCIMAIRLAIEYINQAIYPSESGASIYNNALQGVRRQLNL
jgi:hypothetical protein